MELPVNIHQLGGGPPPSYPPSYPQAIHDVSPKALELLRVLEQGPKTRSEIMKSMNVKDRKSLRENYINPVWEANYIACNTLILINNNQFGSRNYRIAF